jgi:hypothetical protein
MKAKYKIGQMVKWTIGTGQTSVSESYGTIDSIIQRSDGYSYTVEGANILESDITCAYAELGKKKKTTRKQSAKRAKMNGHAEQAAHVD